MHKTIYTLRHSATDAAKKKVILGRLDEDINEDGHALIRSFLAVHGKIPHDRLISSPLKRALTTAKEISAGNEREIITSDLCMERNYGKLQGVKPGELPFITPETFYVDVGGVKHSLNPPGGETLEDVRRRTEAFMDYLFDLPGTLLVVSHQCFLVQMHGLIRNQDVYHSLASDLGILELNRFVFKDRNMVEEEQEFSMQGNAYGSW